MPEQYDTISGGSANEIAASVEAGGRLGRAGSPASASRRAHAGQLARRLPHDVAAALAELRRRGVVVSRPRSGTRISDRPPVRPSRAPATVPAGMRDLALGNPDPALLPELDRRRAPSGSGSTARRPSDAGLVAVAGAALAADGISAERLTVVNGALDGIERVLAAHLSPGDLVAVEDPGWPGVLDLVRALGLRLAPVAVDERGMRPDALAAALRLGARAAVLTPRGQNPVGAAFDAERAGELRELLRDVLVVEDDHLGPVAGVPWHSVGGRERALGDGPLGLEVARAGPALRDPRGRRAHARAGRGADVARARAG